MWHLIACLACGESRIDWVDMREIDLPELTESSRTQARFPSVLLLKEYGHFADKELGRTELISQHHKLSFVRR